MVLRSLRISIRRHDLFVHRELAGADQTLRRRGEEYYVENAEGGGSTPLTSVFSRSVFSTSASAISASSFFFFFFATFFAFLISFFATFLISFFSAFFDVLFFFTIASSL